MNEEFTLVENGITFIFRRMYHPEVELAYHVHVTNLSQRIIFRMKRNARGNWKILHQDLPESVWRAEARLAEAIASNEQAPGKHPS
ncbi:hypothetical protein GCM10023184_10410 [Flaviaesturariibacter amylovorans]|uniref:Uncharacterized protein n=2 Tax=Flaviaesturariibacter amylovorans TaxID=1084520 RepID=A0ABP8GFX6_9BACT